MILYIFSCILCFMQHIFWIDSYCNFNFVSLYVLCLVAHSCPTLCDPMDCSLPGSSVHGDPPGKNTGVGCQILCQRIFPIQGSNPGLLHCWRILYHLSHQGSHYTKKEQFIYLSSYFGLWGCSYFFFSIVNSVENHSYTSSFMQIYKVFMNFPGGSDGKESVCNVGDQGLIHGLGKFPGEGNSNPLQYSCLANPMYGGGSWVTVHGITKSWTWLRDKHIYT